jgi:uncharacterized protein
MKIYLMRLYFFNMVLAADFSFSADKLNVLIVIGGHDFDRKSFFEMFDSFKNISCKELTHPEAYHQLGQIDPASFDAVVFCDMPPVIKEEEKNIFNTFVKEGKGLLFLHHSLCSMQDWNEYKLFTSGKYYEKKKDEIFGASSYQHDVRFMIHIVNQSNPVTKGIKDFAILDEVYRNLDVQPDVQPLLFTDNPKSNKLIGWTFIK